MWRWLLVCIRANPSLPARPTAAAFGARSPAARGGTGRRPTIVAPLVGGRLRSGALVGTVLVALVGALAAPTRAQDWGSDPEEDWSTPARSAPASSTTGWSLRAGVGFTAGPDTFLMNFEVPYAFDRWVSAGPMVQVGLTQDDLIVAPSMNVAITIPDLPGEALDRFVPYGFAGLGFAVIQDDDRRNSNTGAGVLIPAGVGLEYRVTDHFAVGSQMTFNFLPRETLSQKFWYSWQVLGLRFSF